MPTGWDPSLCPLKRGCLPDLSHLLSGISALARQKQPAAEQLSPQLPAKQATQPASVPTGEHPEASLPSNKQNPPDHQNRLCSFFSSHPYLPDSRQPYRSPEDRAGRSQTLPSPGFCPKASLQRGAAGVGNLVTILLRRKILMFFKSFSEGKLFQ